MANFNEKYEDLEKLHENKVITTFQMLLLHELRMLNLTLDEDFEGGINDKLSRIYGSVDDLSSDLNDMFTEMQETIKNNQ